jgi:hypothetical protein
MSRSVPQIPILLVRNRTSPELGVGRGASISLILSALPGVTAIAFRKLSYPMDRCCSGTPLGFLESSFRGSIDDLRSLLETIQSRFDDIYKLHS